MYTYFQIKMTRIFDMKEKNILLSTQERERETESQKGRRYGPSALEIGPCSLTDRLTITEH